MLSGVLMAGFPGGTSSGLVAGEVGRKGEEGGGGVAVQGYAGVMSRHLRTPSCICMAGDATPLVLDLFAVSVARWDAVTVPDGNVLCEGVHWFVGTMLCCMRRGVSYLHSTAVHQQM